MQDINADVGRQRRTLPAAVQQQRPDEDLRALVQLFEDELNRTPARWEPTHEALKKLALDAACLPQSAAAQWALHATLSGADGETSAGEALRALGRDFMRVMDGTVQLLRHSEHRAKAAAERVRDAARKQYAYAVVAAVRVGHACAAAARAARVLPQRLTRTVSPYRVYTIPQGIRTPLHRLAMKLCGSVRAAHLERTLVGLDALYDKARESETRRVPRVGPEEWGACGDYMGGMGGVAAARAREMLLRDARGSAPLPVIVANGVRIFGMCDGLRGALQVRALYDAGVGAAIANSVSAAIASGGEVLNAYSLDGVFERTIAPAAIDSFSDERERSEAVQHLCTILAHSDAAWAHALADHYEAGGDKDEDGPGAHARNAPHPCILEWYEATHASRQYAGTLQLLRSGEDTRAATGSTHFSKLSLLQRFMELHLSFAVALRVLHLSGALSALAPDEWPALPMQTPEPTSAERAASRSDWNAAELMDAIGAPPGEGAGWPQALLERAVAMAMKTK